MASNDKLVKQLIDGLRQGKYEDPNDKISLLSAALVESNSSVEQLVSLLRAPQIPLRLAAVDACRERKEPELWNQLALLADDKEYSVRSCLIGILKDWGFDHEPCCQLVLRLFEDDDDSIRSMIVRQTSGESRFLEAQLERLRTDDNYYVRYSAVGAVAESGSETVGKDLFDVMLNDIASGIQQQCAELLDKKLGKNSQRKKIEEQLPTDITLLRKAKGVAEELDSEKFPRLNEWITNQLVNDVNPDQLKDFGTDLTNVASQGKLPRAYGVDHILDKIRPIILGEHSRSVVLLGETGVGKSAIINELVYQLQEPQNGAWRVLRISPTEFLIGTKYVGEWQNKVADLIKTCKKSRKILIYVPSVGELSGMGRYENSDANVASALAPFIEDGSIIIVGESTISEYEQGMGSIPSLNRLFERILIPESSEAETRKLLSTIRDNLKANIDDSMLDNLYEVSNLFLGHSARPGKSASLLRQITDTHPSKDEPITNRMVLDVVSQSTGIPTDFLDDDMPLDQRKSSLLDQINDPEFHRDKVNKATVYDEIHRLDQFLSTVDGLSKVARGIDDRLSRPITKRDVPSLQDRIERLLTELDHLSMVATGGDADSLSDAYVRISLVDVNGERTIGGVEKLAAMYTSFASKRKLTFEVVSEMISTTDDVIYLHIAGLGAYSLLKREVGIHRLDNRYKARSGRNGKEKHHNDREVVRIDVFAAETPDKAFLSKVKSTVVSASARDSRFLKGACFDVSLFHEPSLRSFQGRLSGPKDVALEKSMSVLFTMIKQLETSIDENDGEELVRHYELGSDAKVKDKRSGKATTRVDQVLKGDLEQFFQ